MRVNFGCIWKAILSIYFLVVINCRGYADYLTISVTSPKSRSTFQRVDVPAMYQFQFGSRVQVPIFEIDPRTKGVFGVIVAVSGMEVPNTTTKSVRHVVFVDGMYRPRTQIAHRGDELEIFFLEPSLGEPSVVFPVIRSVLGATRHRFRLERFVDHPVAIANTAYPWVNAYIYVCSKTYASCTDRLGEAIIPKKTTQKTLTIKLYYPYATFRIVKSSIGAVRNNNTIIVDRDSFQRASRIKIMISFSDISK